MDDERVLTPEQVALRLQVQPQTVVRWLRSGRLKGRKFGRIWRVRPEDLDTFIQGTAAARAVSIDLGDTEDDSARD